MIQQIFLNLILILKIRISVYLSKYIIAYLLICYNYYKSSDSESEMKDQCYQFIKGPNNKITIAGFGSYGQVKIAKNVQTGEKVAIKMIHGRNAKDQIDVHHKLNHPKIIRLLNYYYQKEKNITYMVLQYAEGGTLHDRIRYGYGQLPKDKVKKYFRDICKAVQYLHSLNYMHRDIKPENILLTNDNAKLCDFGFAAILEFRSTLCGTYQYMAPQMIQEKPYDYKIDIWALGILLFQLIQGTAPFRGNSGQDVINEMKKNIVFSNRFQKQEIDLIKKILRVNAQNRPDVSTILASPYLKDLPDDSEQKSNPNQNNRAVSSLSTQSGSTNTTSNYSQKSNNHHQPHHHQKTWQKQKDREDKQRQHQKLQNFTLDKLSIPSLKNQKQKQFHKQKPIKTQPSQNTETKQFKYYVPQGVKTNLTALKQNQNSGSNPGVSHQGFSSSQTGITPNPNTSVDSTYTSSSYTHKQPQTQVPSFLSSHHDKLHGQQNTGYNSNNTGVGIGVNSGSNSNYHPGFQQGQTQRIGVNPNTKVGYVPPSNVYGTTNVVQPVQLPSRTTGVTGNYPGYSNNLIGGTSLGVSGNTKPGVIKTNTDTDTDSNSNVINSNTPGVYKYTPSNYRKN